MVERKNPSTYGRVIGDITACGARVHCHDISCGVYAHLYPFVRTLYDSTTDLLRFFLLLLVFGELYPELSGKWQVDVHARLLRLQSLLLINEDKGRQETNKHTCDGVNALFTYRRFLSRKVALRIPEELFTTLPST